MTRIIIFAKAPQPGFAKTRLTPALGQEGAARLARRMLEETLCSAIEADIGPVELCMTPEITSPSWLDVNIPNIVKVSTQGDGDLGARLARAVQRGIENGDPVLLIGTDCVEMSRLLLREAAAALERNVAVIHATTDGGYALLGLTQFHPLLFKDVAWSTNCVASKTISRIEQLGWSLQIGALLHDVDEPEDLVHVPANWLRTCHT
jgi:rSAM/selenodomain-associated transferase 1